MESIQALNEIAHYADLLNKINSVINGLQKDEFYTKEKAVADLTDIARSFHEEIIGRSF